MNDQNHHLARLVEELGLRWTNENWAVGMHDGVPLAVNAVVTTEAAGLLFHVRYPETKFASENPPLPDSSGLKNSVDAKTAEVSLGDKIGWLNIFSQERNLDPATVQLLLREFFDVVKHQGVDLRLRLCLKCAAQPIERPELENDRLQLACEACKAESKEKFRRETDLHVTNLPLLLIPGAVGALLGALVWGGIWYGFHLALQRLGSVYVPIIIVAALLSATGIPVGKVAAYFITKVRNRGIRVAGFLAVFICAASILLGELFVTAALCLEVIGFLPPLDAVFQLWTAIFREFSGAFLIGKVISAVTALYIAYSAAIPKVR